MMLPFRLHRRLPLIRRPFEQRDQALRERDAWFARFAALQAQADAMRAERDAAITERDRARAAQEREKAEKETVAGERDRVRAELEAASAERDALVADLAQVQLARAEAVEHLGSAQSFIGQIAHGMLPVSESLERYVVEHVPAGAWIAAPPQRYTENYQEYLSRGGSFRADDLGGFIERKPEYIFDQARLFFFTLCFDLIEKQVIPGDFVELGVAKGNTANVLAIAARRLKRRLFLLDTFEGFSPADLVGADQRHGVQYADTSIDEVKWLVGTDKVCFIKGHFPESSAQLPLDCDFCLVHLDCDLYRPFIAALNYFWPRLNDGGFLIMHDYLSLYWDGVEQAVDEFFAGRAEYIVPVPDASGTVVVRKVRS
ncbi:MAG TPA: TylF/MycF/NovP-related O-methyltransferase [Acetobacteraceae bacterium]|nr:TylF/MycF/NovP-related O-methyltransferase [Acetobacteraceae bacterium]